LILFFLVFFTSCSDKYLTYKRNYQFKSKDGKPDYSDLNYWAAHPWKWDPSDSIPKPLMNEVRDSLVDVFFLHPTTLTKKSLFDTQANAAIDDDYLNAKTDYSSMLYQASVFNQQCRVFAPRYRQAHIQNFFSKDTQQSHAAYEIAYSDIKAAFEYYLKHYNKGRPIIIAGHSQGAFMAERLLKEFFEDKPLKNKLVVAYLAGWPVPKTYFTSLEMCADSLQTGCLCSWRTFKNGFVPFYLKNENGNSFATNPITWTTSTEFASRKLNKGSILTKFNKLFKNTADAQIKNGLLYTRKIKFPWSFLLTSKNYHVGDINLYYVNIRENVSRRIAMYWKK
jgi:pimeloyl-ACP methyl ester carboxylesterase